MNDHGVFSVPPRTRRASKSRRWYHNWPVKEFTNFEAGLSLIPVLPVTEVVPLLEERCRRLEGEVLQAHSLADIRRRDNVPRLFVIEAEYRLHLLKSELGWIRKLRADIASGDLEGIALWREWHA